MRVILKQSLDFGERGIALVLTAICSFALVGVLVLALGLAYLYAGSHKLQYTVESTCVGALETYLNSEADTTEEKRVEAWKRASALAGINFSFNRIADSENTLQNALGYTPLGGSPPDEPNGYIEFGEWITGARTTSLCQQANQPCFRPLGSASEKITAVRVQLRTAQDNPLRFVLGRVLGLESMGLARSAVCGMIPRYALVLPDLSRSSAYDTHVPIETYPRDPSNPTHISTMQATGLGTFIFSMSDELDGMDPRSDTRCIDDFAGESVTIWDEHSRFQCTYQDNPPLGPIVTRIYSEHMNPCLDNPVASEALERIDESAMPPLNVAVPRGSAVDQCRAVGQGASPINLLLPNYFTASPDPDEVPHCPTYWEGDAALAYGIMRNSRALATNPIPGDHEHFRSDYKCWYSRWKGFPTYRLVKACYDTCLAAFPLHLQSESGQSLVIDINYKKFWACTLGANFWGVNPPPQCLWSRDGDPPESCHYAGCEANGHNKLVDVYVDFDDSLSPGNYPRPGPEPFVSFMRGTNRLLRIFEERAIGDDRVGMIGFDRLLRYPQRYFAMSAPGTKMFELMEQITDVENTAANAASAGWVRSISDPNQGSVRGHNFSPQMRLWMMHMFLPGTLNNYTNVSRALRYALRYLLEQPNASGRLQRDVILMTDMISNCVNSSPFDKSIFQDLYTSCQDRGDAYTKSRQEIEYVVDQYFVPKDIALNVVLSGSYVGPHTLLKCDGQGKVIDPAKALRLDLEEDFTLVDSDGGSYESMTQTAPFFGPNYAYDLTWRTRGLFLALRPPCETLTEEMLNGACGGKSKGEFGDRPAVPFDEVDGNWRILCDAKRRSKAEQVSDFMKEIMGLNAIRLVGPEGGPAIPPTPPAGGGAV